MPSRKKRARRRRGGSAFLPTLIAILALVAAVLVLILLRSDPMQIEDPATLPFTYTQEPVFAQQGGTVAPLVLGSTPTPAPTPQATATPAPAETAQPGPTNRLEPTPRPGDYFLPIYDRALRTADDELMIAITIDDCDDADAMSKILSLARRYNADMTLFVNGSALETSGMREGFRSCVKNLGFELENHGLNEKAEFKLSNMDLALQMWKQDQAISEAMRADYQQHFYRPYSIHAVGDQRTHFYARKLGYKGIAGYTHSYQDGGINVLVNSLDNGDIYHFDMSEDSMEKLESFMFEANHRGYKMVTMNALFGLEKNALSNELTTKYQTMPGMDDYVESHYDLRLNDRCRAVYTLQERLVALGYLDRRITKIDGIYGSATSTAVSAFQAKIGIPATGNATAETLERLFAEGAPRGDV